MTISSLHITAFRNLAEARLLPCPGLNIIYGRNASGKTSLLEAIYFLGQGKSFRTSTPSRLISQKHTQFSICSQVVDQNNGPFPVGIERHITGGMRLRIREQEKASMTELAYHLPTRLIHSQSHQVFESGPVFRRKFLDWGLFYQSEQFLSCWRQFERVLKQRNTLLRDQCSKPEIDPWTMELVKQGSLLDHLRREYVKALVPLVLEIANELFPLPHLAFSYHSGWDSVHSDYAAVLNYKYDEDKRLGHTQYGPHRADFTVFIDTVPVKHFLSRGQQKLLICAMIIAQGKLLAKQTNKRLIYLVDDLPSELDLQSRKKLLDLFAIQPAQVFITAIESEMISSLLNDQYGLPVRMFHVEHGTVSSMP